MFLREAGYSIAIALIDNTPEVAKQRALSRFMKEGRYASDSYIEAPECSAKHQAPAVALTIDSNIVKSCQCEISEHGEHDEHPCSPPFRTCRKITPNWKRWSRPWCFECPLWCSLWCPLCNSPASASFRSKKPTIATTIALNPLRENAWSAGLTRARGPRGFWLPRSCSFHHSSDTSCNKSRKGQNNQLVSFLPEDFASCNWHVVDTLVSTPSSSMCTVDSCIQSLLIFFVEPCFRMMSVYLCMRG